MATAATSRIGFLGLPPEIRKQVYELSITFTRLSRTPILDPDFPATCRKFSPAVPSLLLTCRLVYQETRSLFYSKATLAIEPCQIDPMDSRDKSGFMKQLDMDYGFCPPQCLQQIQHVHVFCNANWATDTDAVHALFHWLIMRTGVLNIWLSRKMMQQRCHINKLVDLEGVQYTVGDHSDAERVIDIFAMRISPRLRVYRCYNAELGGRGSLSLQVHEYKIDRKTTNRLSLQPLSSFLSNDHDHPEKRELIVRNHGRVSEKCFENPFFELTRRNGRLALLLSIFIR